ncbi:winged helix-turn-helix transcriptional regulator [Pseudotabrizicola algicola]|nr:helix-turn-helix domain-containing protein [Pseudotabrizicola algicola]
MTGIRRSYEEGCIAAHALDLIGDRWALLVVRELMLGPRRFGAIRAGLPGVSANILTRRLEELEAAGLVLREALREGAGFQSYRLTEAGMGLWPVIRALCRWGAAMPGHDPSLFISPVSLMLSLRAMCARGRAGPHEAVMIAAGESFVIRTAPGAFRVERGEAAGAGLRFAGSTNALAATLYGPMPLAQCAAGLIGFEGDPAQGQAFVDLFSLRPEAAG